jgi:hypothetical protein
VLGNRISEIISEDIRCIKSIQHHILSHLFIADTCHYGEGLQSGTCLVIVYVNDTVHAIMVKGQSVA